MAEKMDARRGPTTAQTRSKSSNGSNRLLPNEALDLLMCSVCVLLSKLVEHGLDMMTTTWAAEHLMLGVHL